MRTGGLAPSAALLLLVGLLSLATRLVRATPFPAYFYVVDVPETEHEGQTQSFYTRASEACHEQRPAACQPSSAWAEVMLSESNEYESYGSFHRPPESYQMKGRAIYFHTSGGQNVLISEDYDNLLGPNPVFLNAVPGNLKYVTGYQPLPGTNPWGTSPPLNCQGFTSTEYWDNGPGGPFGVTFGTGFTAANNGSAGWYREDLGDLPDVNLARCNETLPVLCLCYPEALRPSYTRYNEFGQLTVRIYQKTNLGGNNGLPRPCDSILDVAHRPPYDRGTCSIVSSRESAGISHLYITLPSNTTWKATDKLVFLRKNALKSPEGYSILAPEPVAIDPEEFCNYRDCAPILSGPTEIPPCATSVPLRLFVKTTFGRKLGNITITSTNPQQLFTNGLKTFQVPRYDPETYAFQMPRDLFDPAYADYELSATIEDWYSDFLKEYFYNPQYPHPGAVPSKPIRIFFTQGANHSTSFTLESLPTNPFMLAYQSEKNVVPADGHIQLRVSARPIPSCNNGNVALPYTYQWQVRGPTVNNYHLGDDFYSGFMDLDVMSYGPEHFEGLEFNLPVERLGILANTENYVVVTMSVIDADENLVTRLAMAYKILPPQLYVSLLVPSIVRPSDGFLVDARGSCDPYLKPSTGCDVSTGHANPASTDPSVSGVEVHYLMYREETPDSGAFYNEHWATDAPTPAQVLVGRLRRRQLPEVGTYDGDRLNQENTLWTIPPNAVAPAKYEVVALYFATRFGGRAGPEFENRRRLVTYPDSQLQLDSLGQYVIVDDQLPASCEIPMVSLPVPRFQEIGAHSRLTIRPRFSGFDPLNPRGMRVEWWAYSTTSEYGPKQYWNTNVTSAVFSATELARRFLMNKELFFEIRLMGGPICPGVVITKATVLPIVIVPPPIVGSMTVSVTPETNGVAALTEYEIRASGCVSMVTSSPVHYRYSYSPSGGLKNDFVALTGFGPAQRIRTRLPLPLDPAVPPRIRVECRDGLGAIESLLSRAVFQVNPLYVPGGALPDPTAFVQSLANASTTERLTAVTSLASSNNVKPPPEDERRVRDWRRDVARAAMTVLVETLPPRGAPVDLDVVKLQIGTLGAIASGEIVLDKTGIFQLSGLINEIIAGTKNATDVSAGAYSPETAGEVLTILSRMAKGLTQVNNQVDEDRRRRLQTQEDLKEAVNNFRASLKENLAAVLRGYEAGSPSIVLESEDIQCVVATETRDAFGITQSTLEINGLRVDLPAGVIGDPSRIADDGQGALPQEIDAALCSFNYNPREVLGRGNDLFNSTSNTTLPGSVSANFTVKQVHMLLFLSRDDPQREIDPVNLEHPIDLTFGLPADYEFPENATTEQLYCGAWDLGLKAWSPRGCNVTAVDTTQGYGNYRMTCSCNHASDYAAWNGFLADVERTFHIPRVVATIAAVVLGIMLPALVVMWLTLMLWARKRDHQDALNVHLGALMLLTKNKLRLMQMQRRFFNKLRENAKTQEKGLATRLQPEELERLELNSIEERERLKRQFESKSCVSCLPRTLRAFTNAVWYEHSLIGMVTRFDPFYTRVQRVATFTALVVGNLFASALFFNLKAATDVSPGFLLGAILLTGLAVSIPIKICVRWLFRSTEAAVGSTMDRVAQIYRVSEMHNNLLPGFATSAETADLHMILAFKDFYVAKGDLQAAKALLRAHEREEGSSSARAGCCARSVDAATRARRLRALKARLDTPSELDSVESIQKVIDDAAQRESLAREKLKDFSILAQAEWKKVPRQVNARVDTLRRQQSVVLKLAALIYDETDERPRSRAKLCGPKVVILSWLLFLAYFIGSMVIIAFWLIQRTSGLETIDGVPADETSANNNALITAWLISAFVSIGVTLFLTEPLLQFVRFSVFPYLLQRYGRGTHLHPKREPSDRALALVQDEPEGGDLEEGKLDKLAKFEKLKQKKGENSGTAHNIGHTVLESAANVVEAIA